MFDFFRRGFSPSSSFLSRHLLEKVGGDRIPASECFYDEWLKEDALRATVFKVRPVFGRFPRFDGGGGGFCCVK